MQISLHDVLLAGLQLNAFIIASEKYAPALARSDRLYDEGFCFLLRELLLEVICI